MHLVADGAIGHNRTRFDFTAAADPGLAAQVNPWMDQSIRADAHIRVDIGRRRINQSHPGTLMGGVDSLAHDFACFGQLYPIVNSHCFLRIVNQQGLDTLAGLSGRGHDIGQIILALDIPVIDISQQGENLRRPKQVDPGIDFPDLAL